MELKSVSIEKDEETQIILGQSHFVKTVEDIYEAVVNSVPALRFGVALCEASMARQVRFDGNDEEMKQLAVRNAGNIAAGHIFIVCLKDAYPINLLQAIKRVPEVCGIFCATANAVEVIIAESEQGRGILGVIDGQPPLGVEDGDKKKKRHDLLRTIGYKR